MPTHIVDINWQANGSIPLSKRITKTADGEFNADIAVAGGSTNLHAVLGIDVSALVSLYLHCDRALLIETNDGTSPDDTINLLADTPYYWHSTSGLENPFASTTDVTDLYLTLAAGAAATLTIRGLQDITP